MIPTAGLTTQKSRSQIAIRIKAPFVLFRSGFSVVFPGCKVNAGTVSPKGPWTNYAKQGCGRAVKFCLCPVLNPHLGKENNCLLSSGAFRMQEWKQHGERHHSCFTLETLPPVRFFDPDPEAKSLSLA